MIPGFIHQTWRDLNIPEPLAWPESWKRLNPGWEYRLWTDDDLLSLVQNYYPELEALFMSYPRAVQRADLGRYLILHHCGGVYADLDTECLSPLDPIAHETRVILAEEPVEHRYQSHPLGLDRLLFNGVMASPQGHPFWRHVMAMLLRCRHAGANVLESTGPLALTGAVESYPHPESLALHSCHLFDPLAETGHESTAPLYGPYAHLRIANHYWQGTWWRQPRTCTRCNQIKRAIRKARYHLTRGAHLTRAGLEAQIDKSLLHKPVQPDEGNVAVLIPVRDAEPFLERCMALLLALDYPKDKLKLVFCEGDSIDQTPAKLRQLAETHRKTFRDIIITTLNTGQRLDRARRWLPKLQKTRRANLAKVRNHLIDQGLGDGDDWVLWLDADVCDYAPGILHRLIAEQRKVVTPDCVLDWGGPSYDLNAFHDSQDRRDHHYYKYVRNGLFMPPGGYARRRHLHDLRFLDRVPLSAVGGTMLLVHATVHRAGVRFPETPYGDLLETEGFGRICRDFGVTPIGLPNIQIRHVSS